MLTYELQAITPMGNVIVVGRVEDYHEAQALAKKQSKYFPLFILVFYDKELKGYLNPNGFNDIGAPWGPDAK